MATTPQAKIEDLQFVRCKVAQAIPRELIEAVKGRTFTPDQFYRYQALNVDNPCNFVFVLIDERKLIHGFLWAEQNSLDGSLFVNTFSVKKEHWGKGGAIPFVVEFLRGFSKSIGATRTFWCTTNEKFFTKHNFKRSKTVLMEYNTDKLKAKDGTAEKRRVLETGYSDGPTEQCA
jgi:hypothetical protein